MAGGSCRFVAKLGPCACFQAIERRFDSFERFIIVAHYGTGRQIEEFAPVFSEAGE